MDQTQQSASQPIPNFQKAANTRREHKEQAIEMVRRLMVRGIRSAIEIQVTLEKNKPPINVTVRTVRRYKAIIKRRNIEKLSNGMGVHKSVEELVLQLKEDYDEITRELWKTYHAPTTGASAKVSALKEIRETTSDLVERLQSLGLIAKAPEKHQLVDKDGNPVDPAPTNIMLLSQEFNAFVKAKLQDPIGSTGNHEVVKRLA